MQPAKLFRHCPRCGAARSPEDVGCVPLRCGGCGLLYFFNPSVAAAAFVFDDRGRALFIRRAHDPAKGKLAIPGGFVDIGETAEGGLQREIREEVGLEVADLAFLGSWPNLYAYREVTYPVVDLVFTARAVAPESARSLDGVAGIEWLRPADIDPAELAFPSIRETLKLLTATASRPAP
ncbi:MAG TPA: NUDIX domain-containing protein [Gemmataceae bacterium]|nr:NUDIX domain-containing protein [Gemmataceae bacterium]